MVIGLRQGHSIPQGQCTQCTRRREDALGLVFLHMLERGGVGDVATLGIAVAEAGGITLACDAKRALLRCQEAYHAPMGLVCKEVIR